VGGSRTAVIAALVMIMVAASLGVAYRRSSLPHPAGAVAASPPQGQLNLAKEYIYAGGRLIATEEPPGGGGPCTPPGSPGNSLVATSFATGSQVSLSWAPTGADHYEVERRPNKNAAWTTLTPNPTQAQFTDTSVTPSTTYLYRVRSMDAGGQCPSDYSNTDLATTMNYADAIAIGVPVKASHLIELRTAVNAVRTAAALSQFDWPDGSSPGSVAVPAVNGPILKNQMQKLRDRLNEARASLGFTPQPFTNEPLTTGTRIFAAHVLELRQGVQ
jgi:hypothetical protein